MDERTEVAPVSTTVVCPKCGHDLLRDGTRIDTFLGPLLIPLLLAAPVALLAAPFPWSWLPLAAAVLLIALRKLGGIDYWGGWKCRGCGHTEMQR
jgi:hypothetical protein